MDTCGFLRDKMTLFREFSDAKLASLVQRSEEATFEANEAVIEFGESGRFLGILLEGEAEVSRADDSGQRHRVVVLRPGDIFGEMSLMSGDKTTADIIGLTRCRALLIPQQVFASSIATEPAAIAQLSGLIARRYRHLEAEARSWDAAASAFRASQDPYGFELASRVPMKLLTINCGSSSLKYQLFDTARPRETVAGSVERIGETGTCHRLTVNGKETRQELARGTHRDAFEEMVRALAPLVGTLGEVKAVAHRVVHGGDKFLSSCVITPVVIEEIERVSVLAPLHNPINVLGIREAMRQLPEAVHVAVFDTSFHHTMPPYAYLYALPYEYYEKKQVRRYGFHGTSHAYVALRAAQFLKRPYNELEIATCHIGNGVSICAVDHGRSVDTSMGLTPAEGLIMGTRSGDIDSAVLLHLMRTEGLGARDLDALINKQGGLLGLSGISNDMRELLKACDAGNNRAILAVKTFCYRLRKYIGAYMAAMGGLDALVFTGGIGLNSSVVRSLACQGLGCFGIALDDDRNRKASGTESVALISRDDAPVRVLVIHTDEERMMARETLRVLSTMHVGRILDGTKALGIPLEVSTHHVHLTQELVEALFGDGHRLTVEQELSQPGQYACRERVILVGHRGEIERVRVLGPARREAQVEIAMTEQYKLGISPPIRLSGDIENTPGITIRGPRGAVTIPKGVICAMRHIHMSPDDAMRFGLRDRDVVRVRVEGARELVFGDVVIRVHPDFRLAMHIDTDEGNAAGITDGMEGSIEGIQSGTEG